MSVQTGEYYFNARWYDPTLGRFISEDPIRDGLNWYAAFGNNPVMNIDPTGLYLMPGECHPKSKDDSSIVGYDTHPDRDGEGTYTVKPGDELNKIAEALLGDASRWTEINGYIQKPESLPIGTVLSHPEFPGGIKGPAGDGGGTTGGGSSGTATVENGSNDGSGRTPDPNSGIEFHGRPDSDNSLDGLRNKFFTQMDHLPDYEDACHPFSIGNGYIDKGILSFNTNSEMNKLADKLNSLVCKDTVEIMQAIFPEKADVVWVRVSLPKGHNLRSIQAIIKDNVAVAVYPAVFYWAMSEEEGHGLSHAITVTNINLIDPYVPRLSTNFNSILGSEAQYAPGRSFNAYTYAYYISTWEQLNYSLFHDVIH